LLRRFTISTEGKIVKLGRQASYAEGFVRDGTGNLAVHATAMFSMIGPRLREPNKLQLSKAASAINNMLLDDCKHLMEPAMRYSREHKLETHARIVKKASVRLRERGAYGIGVADLMKEAGLTHGGFYAHFDSREALVVEAFAFAMDRSTERWRKLAEGTPPEKRLATLVESYLTTAHRDDPGHGCAVPTLGAEIAREAPKTRKAFAAKLEQMIDMIAEQIPGLPPKAARKQAMAAIATMMGSLVMARIAGNGEFSDQILAAGREAVLDRAKSPKRAATKRPGRKAVAAARH
jgi:TetR/AcrR family transcriptional repressor of nem operon